MFKNILTGLSLGMGLGSIYFSLTNTDETIDETIAERRVKSLKNDLAADSLSSILAASKIPEKSKELLRKYFVDSDFYKDEVYYQTLGDVIQRLPDTEFKSYSQQAKLALLEFMAAIVPQSGRREYLLFKRELGFVLNQEEANLVK